MGCESSDTHDVHSHIPPYHLNRLLQVSDINHPLNINKKYSHLSQIVESKEVGSGILKTYAWVALATKPQIQAKIAQYWDSRTNGQPHIWEVLHTVSKMSDQKQALQLVQSNQISMLKGTIQMCVDSKLNKYEVPIFCINDPVKYSEELIEDKNLNLNYEDKTMQVSIRSTKFPNGDIKMSQRTSCLISQIKKGVIRLKNLKQTSKIRLFYTGRQMKDDKVLGNYNYAPGTVIQAMII